MKPTADNHTMPLSLSNGVLVSASTRQMWSRFGFVVLMLSLGFIVPLFQLGRLAYRFELYSHVFLIPGIAAYLVWIERKSLPITATPWIPAALGIGAFGLGCLLVSFALDESGPVSIGLALRISGYVLGIVAAACLCLGRNICRFCAFSLLFLAFMIPLPTLVVKQFETTLQYASAEVADWFFVGSRTPSIRDGLYFRLPGLTLEVAPECSGLRSTLVLLIVSMVASKMFLRTPWKRAVLIFAVVPLGIARNAFRIFTLGFLSVNLDPRIIHSPLHHQGGPLFFLISLVPLNLLLWLLYRSERNLRSSPNTTENSLRP